MKRNFAEHPKSIFWSKKNLVTPEEVALYSRKKFLFDCLCGHEFEIRPHDIISGNSWCSYCSNPAKKLCNKELNCVQCYNKSFASHPRAIFWSDKNDMLPNNIFKYSHKKCWFNCNCGHEFECILSDISHNNSWCSYCGTPSRKLCINDCISCFNKSFASEEKSKYWSIKNLLLPREVFKSSAKKYWFNCNCGNEFETRVSHVTSGVWCAKCRYKTEDKILIILTKVFPLISSQVKFEWCKNIKHLIYDFVIEERKIIIELDGIQHFKQVSNWKSPNDNLINDKYKMNCANNNNYSIIRILQDDVYNNSYDWLNELNNNIKKIINENKVQNIFLCTNNEYVLYS